MAHSPESRPVFVDPQRLADIPRPNHTEIMLPAEDALLINDSLIIGFRSFGRNLLVARERTLPILRGLRDSSEQIFTRMDDEDAKGKYGTVIFPVDEVNFGFYVGKDYKVNFEELGGERKGYMLKIDSTSEINKLKRIDVRLMYGPILEKLAAGIRMP